MITVREYLAANSSLDYDERRDVAFAGIAIVTPDQFREFTGISANFKRRDGRNDAPPSSVVYRAHPLTGEYLRVMEMEGYGDRPYQHNGPLGGTAVRSTESIEFVVFNSAAKWIVED